MWADSVDSVQKLQEPLEMGTYFCLPFCLPFLLLFQLLSCVMLLLGMFHSHSICLLNQFEINSFLQFGVKNYHIS